jgi:hypothetical protein
MKTAVIPSAVIGLLGETDNIITSGDGTCISLHASPFGRKTYKCIGTCDCTRSFADPQAKWGGDSYHERWFFGYSAYLLSVHNKVLKLDLPLYLKFVDAPRYDSVSLFPPLHTFDSSSRTSCASTALSPMPHTTTTRLTGFSTKRPFLH